MQVIDNNKEFLDAVELVKTLKSCSNENKLELYGMYKQAHFGDNLNAIPSIFYYTDRSKWNAWDSYRGKTSDEMKKEYILFVKNLKKNEN